MCQGEVAESEGGRVVQFSVSVKIIGEHTEWAMN